MVGSEGFYRSGVAKIIPQGWWKEANRRDESWGSTSPILMVLWTIVLSKAYDLSIMVGLTTNAERLSDRRRCRRQSLFCLEPVRHVTILDAPIVKFIWNWSTSPWLQVFLPPYSFHVSSIQPLRWRIRKSGKHMISTLPENAAPGYT